MTPQEKAAAYDKAIERTRRMIEDYKNRGLDNYYACAKESLEKIFPELAESEDERTRKWLICYLHKQRGFLTEENHDEYNQKLLNAVAWLEKQGEQKPAMIQWKGNNLKEVIDFTGIYKDGFEKWFHNSWEEYEKYVHEHNNIFKIFNKDGSHIEVPVGAWIVKTPDGYNTSSRYVFRQKPAWSEEDIMMKGEIINVLQKTGNYEKEINWLKSLKDRVQPKQEWSEEDGNHFKSILSTIECCKAQFPNSQAVVEAYNADIEWLKSLKGRVQPQTRQEWSEEDEKLIDYVCSILIGNWNEDEKLDLDFPCMGKVADQLKSLKDRVFPQPKKEWGEEDKKMLQETIEFVESVEERLKNIDGFKDIKDWLKSLKDRVQPQPKQEWSEEDDKALKSIINDISQGVVPDEEDTNWLKSLRPQSQWKPSDMELEVLRLAAEKDGTCLMGLYEQLKKLREG